jgi:hypothetical protein
VIVREISTATDQTASFFHALDPPLAANVLTVVLVYCFAMINQGRKAERRDATQYMANSDALFLMLYGLYTWGDLSLQKIRQIWGAITAK